MFPHLIFGIPATLGLFFLALLASRRANHESAALERLRQEQLRRETAEESLRQSQKMNAVGQLTAGIAHDFNNLLTGIGGAVEMVGRRIPQPTPEVTRFLDLARSGVSRAATLTQRLLAFSRQQPLQIEAIDANKLVSGMSELLRRTLGEKVRVETVLSGGLWRAKADMAQLESAILNLAINGRDSMAAGGTLTIETANAQRRRTRISTTPMPMPMRKWRRGNMCLSPFRTPARAWSTRSSRAPSSRSSRPSSVGRAPASASA
jgi:signal transduction histidine kinase